MPKDIQFILYNFPEKEGKVQVIIRDETLWCTQKAMAQLFGVDRTVVSKHLKNIFESAELQQDSVCAKFAHTTSCMSSPEADLAKRTKIKPACAGLEESQNRLRRLHHCILQFDQKDFQHGSA